MRAPRNLLLAACVLLFTALATVGCGGSSTSDEVRSTGAESLADEALVRSTTVIRVSSEERETAELVAVTSSSTTTTKASTSTTRRTTTTVSSTTTEAPTTTSTSSTTTSLPTDGSGIFVWASDPGQPVGRAPYRTYQVGVELGSGLDPDVVAAVVEVILGDRRSWIGDGRTGFQRVVSGASLRVVIATPKTTDRLCAPLRTNGWLSCAQGRYAAINLHRWLTATDEWDAPLMEYWRYVINHEMGHQVGKGHVYCPGEGKLAPVMQQQTKTLDGCRPNGWPYPDNRAG